MSEIQGRIKEEWKHCSVYADQFGLTKLLLLLSTCVYYTLYYWYIDQKLPITLHGVASEVCFILVDFPPKIK